MKLTVVRAEQANARCYGDTHLVKRGQLELTPLYCQCGRSYRWVTVVTHASASLGLLAV